jgi:hypothetical protein
MKEIYEANPESWIVLWSIPIRWMNHGKWVKSINPAFIDENYYKLIHIKHKQVLDAYLANGKVEIEYEFNEETYNNAGWYTEHNFIEEYSPDLDYRIKEKEDEDNRTSDDTNTTMDDSVDSDDIESKMTTNMVSNEAINSFTAHGFEVPDFAGEILKEIDGFYIGYVKDDVGFSPTAERWTKEGKHMNDEIADEGYNLTPIKNPWYEDETNFPALITDGEDYTSCASQETWLQSYYISEVNWKLATKAERDSLYYKED